MSAIFSSTLKYLIPSLNHSAANRRLSFFSFTPSRFLTLATSILKLIIAELASPSLTSREPRRNEHLAVLLPKHLWKV